nr:hypothetical protein [Streptomyces spongiae]
MHKRRSKQLAKAKAKVEKAEKNARKAAEAVAVAVAVLEDPAARCVPYAGCVWRQGSLLRRGGTPLLSGC